ncbi:uncharacterized protein CEXT_167051 [Caerostris extrusa]|uniref:Zinc finger protein Rlf/292/654 TPR repeats domain-containing protein n=1 Tax=Caerostris extrusa TaxID=172846 RepID=A0AAV4T1Q0_CAEEX|nr:uncharacterized protein CEXT_167051 [Caerostris extrusa]
MHKETQSPLSKIVEDAHVLISQNAPTSAHFYLFVDVFHKHYGTKCIELIIEFYVRGLTIDINHLENKRHSGALLDANSLEIHIANTFIKLSSLFFKSDSKVARECIFSAFSLRPTPKRLAALKYLAQKLLRDSQNSDSNNFSTEFSSSKTIKSDGFTHPILIDGIKNVSNSILDDFVTVLENVRDIKFQYNVFDWKNINELDNYLKLHEIPPNESDVEISNDEIYDVDPNEIVLNEQRNWIKKRN